METQRQREQKQRIFFVLLLLLHRFFFSFRTILFVLIAQKGPL
jgi:hypothetical protein